METLILIVEPANSPLVSSHQAEFGVAQALQWLKLHTSRQHEGLAHPWLAVVGGSESTQSLEPGGIEGSISQKRVILWLWGFAFTPLMLLVSIQDGHWPGGTLISDPAFQCPHTLKRGRDCEWCGSSTVSQCHTAALSGAGAPRPSGHACMPLPVRG